MTSKEFVLSIYPNAYFSRGIVWSAEYGNLNILYSDPYGTWAEKWIDKEAIDYAWEQAAECVNKRILSKLEQ